VNLIFTKDNLMNLNPNRKVATKGGSMPSIFQMPKG